MLHVALAGLLAVPLALTPPDDTGDDKKSAADKATTETVATPGVFELNPVEEPEAITLDTYAMGRTSADIPLKLWAQYAWGTAADIYTPNNDVDRIRLGAPLPGSEAEVVSQRIAVGGQINFVNLSRFAVGVGAQLGLAKNELNFDNDAGPIGGGNLESDFGLQQVKVYGTARGRVVGIHGGYAFDLGSEQEFAEIPGTGGLQFPTNLSNSDGRDAIFVGADFDYPSDRFRLLGGIDYYSLAEGEDDFGDAITGGDFLNYAFGLGVRFPVFELGAVLQIQTRFDEPTLENVGTVSGLGSHIGTVVPYLRFSPPSFPASIYVKGATPDEYLEFGAPIGGQNSVQPGLGFTAGLSIGFE